MSTKRRSSHCACELVHRQLIGFLRCVSCEAIPRWEARVLSSNGGAEVGAVSLAASRYIPVLSVSRRAVSRGTPRAAFGLGRGRHAPEAVSGDALAHGLGSGSRCRVQSVCWPPARHAARVAGTPSNDSRAAPQLVE